MSVVVSASAAVVAAPSKSSTKQEHERHMTAIPIGSDLRCGEGVTHSQIAPRARSC
jgi:hypothetical protein